MGDKVILVFLVKVYICALRYEKKKKKIQEE